MFIELAGGETEIRRSGLCHMSLLRISVRYRATHSINIPRLWRSGIREFANSIPLCRKNRTTSVQEGGCEKTQQVLTYLAGNVRIASSYSPAASDNA